MQDAAGGLEIEGHGAVVEDTAPAFEEADELIPVMEDAFAYHGTNNGVEAGAIPASR